MKTVTITESTLKDIIRGLEAALNVCYNVDKTDERTYPYAVGYSKGVMETLLYNLKNIKSQTI